MPWLLASVTRHQQVTSAISQDASCRGLESPLPNPKYRARPRALGSATPSHSAGMLSDPKSHTPIAGHPCHPSCNLAWDSSKPPLSRPRRPIRGLQETSPGVWDANCLPHLSGIAFEDILGRVDETTPLPSPLLPLLKSRSRFHHGNYGLEAVQLAYAVISLEYRHMESSDLLFANAPRLRRSLNREPRGIGAVPQWPPRRL
ncbi:hypothetical protein CONLIGDRAFT_686610 [Coniochaeta ligniaria NRRL 30616]|uniref:Uncharacterized protein n=1 Tax=Coniochaeta ligniaria NRRL 30616 TaxID=1408157 RepID=A0A1J7I7R7_9PEZI|nr:hypothetical protein CONLIGDRAFT_686610 [Coniochaeta ligniaria NRRL 30616]